MSGGRAITMMIVFVATACADAPELRVEPSSAAVRAERRLFDGAPPVIPHEAMGAACVGCHHDRFEKGPGVAVAGLGLAPPSPHAFTAGLSLYARCEQCHVYATGDDKPWVESTFVGLAQDLRRGVRLYPGAPPVMPHAAFMRENCHACHAGEAAREAIRTTHPERVNCRQCHVEAVTIRDAARERFGTQQEIDS